MPVAISSASWGGLAGGFLHGIPALGGLGDLRGHAFHFVDLLRHGGELGNLNRLGLGAILKIKRRHREGRTEPGTYENRNDVPLLGCAGDECADPITKPDENNVRQQERPFGHGHHQRQRLGCARLADLAYFCFGALAHLGGTLPAWLAEVNANRPQIDTGAPTL